MPVRVCLCPCAEGDTGDHFREFLGNPDQDLDGFEDEVAAGRQEQVPAEQDGGEPEAAVEDAGGNQDADGDQAGGAGAVTELLGGDVEGSSGEATVRAVDEERSNEERSRELRDTTLEGAAVEPTEGAAVQPAEGAAVEPAEGEAPGDADEEAPTGQRSLADARALEGFDVLAFKVGRETWHGSIRPGTVSSDDNTVTARIDWFDGSKSETVILAGAVACACQFSSEMHAVGYSNARDNIARLLGGARGGVQRLPFV